MRLPSERRNTRRFIARRRRAQRSGSAASPGRARTSARPSSRLSGLVFMSSCPYSYSCSWPSSALWPSDLEDQLGRAPGAVGGGERALDLLRSRSIGVALAQELGQRG